MKHTSTYPLRLTRSIKAEVMRRAREEGISVNQFWQRLLPKSWRR